MKRRVQLDSALLSVVVVFAGLLYFFPHVHPKSPLWNSICDFFGVLFILKGVMLRMVARGHKMFHSKGGDALVTTGIYKVVRNPMYLGTFYIGTGFIIILCPWWGVLIFTILFFLRFKRQIAKEEKRLSKFFGEKYENYCKTTPAIIPNFSQALKIKPKETFNFDEALATKERRGFFGWPLLALVLEAIQQRLLFGYVDLVEITTVFLSAIAFFLLVFWIYYYLRT